MRRPSFSDLTPAQQGNFGNGVGPYWLPASARRWITKTASWFFRSASWRHHDFGYAVGGDRWDRARCDWKFLQAMLRDAVTQDGGPIAPAVVWLVLASEAAVLSLLFYLAVRIGGQFGSFEYRDQYASLEEVLEAYR
ncbi:hypothetical protein RA27_20625 [Ruegeria sp. ANG-R]|uniref:hypothetical protein n=1 Tax=Ruegeria sp. ANG-R TaxID=1577903 RepID=UPI000580A40F|nr:hypothetical protein [Ruegeria sp. ANG-R]KIC38168.1 hypothetical protein RA27_20625 [Ruegeria sp. ANG-R]